MKRIPLILLSLLISIIFNSIGFAETKGFQPKNINISGFLEETNRSVKISNKISTEEFSLFGEDLKEYELSVDFSLKKQKQKVLFEEIRYQIDDSFHVGNKQGKFLFSEQEPSKNGLIEVKLVPSQKNSQDGNYFPNGIKLSDYDELLIEYLDIDTDNAANVDFSLLLESDVDSDVLLEKANILLQSSLFLEEVAMEDVITSSWLPKNAQYLFERRFGLERDNDWRYVQDGKWTVIQKRFDRDLSNILALDLELDIAIPLQGVNFRLRTEDGDEVIAEWVSEGIIKQSAIDRNNNGNQRVRLLLLDLKKKYKNLVLEELIVFVDGTVDKILQNRPLYSLHWMGTTDEIQNSTLQDDKLDLDQNDSRDNTQMLELVIANTQIENLNRGYKRLKVDLNEVLRRVDYNSNIISAKLLIKPKNQNNLGGVEISKFSLNSQYDDVVPLLEEQGRDLLEKKWKVNLDSFAINNELSVWPIIYKYSNASRDLISENSIEPWVDIEWKVDKNIHDSSFLYVGGIDINDKVTSIKASTFSSLGEILGSWDLQLNESVQLESFEEKNSRIDYIKIRFFLDQRKDKVNYKDEEDLNLINNNKPVITELVLFKVDNLSFNQILDTSLPLQQEIPLNINIESQPPGIYPMVYQDGLVRFFMMDDKKYRGDVIDNKDLHGDLVFSTLIKDLDRSENEYIFLNYEAPWFFPLLNKCWLEMTTKNSKREMSQTICLNSSYGERRIPLPKWADQINWRIVKPYENNLWSNLGSDIFNLSMKLRSDINFTYPINQLLDRPIISLQDKLFYINDELTRAGGNLYFDLGELQYDISLSDIKNLENPWLKVQGITLERKKPLSEIEWQGFGKKELAEGISSLSWTKIIKYLLMAFAIAFFAFWRLIISSWLINALRIVIGLPLVFWSLLFWTVFTFLIYAAGILISDGLGENYYFTFGGMAAVMSWRALINYLNPRIESQWPRLSKKINSGPGTKYFSGFFVVLIGVSVMLMLKVNIIAQELALIGYYMLVVGVVLEILDLWKNKSNINQENNTDK